MSEKKNEPSGSPGNGEPAFLATGRIRRPHGVHGEMVVELYTDFPERLKPPAMVFVGPGRQPMEVIASRHHNEGLLILFKGIDSPETAGHYRNQIIYSSTAILQKLNKGQYYHHQLIGLQVHSDQGEQLGVLTEIIETGANDVYIVQSAGGKEILLPAIPEVIISVELKQKRILVHLLPGLVDNGQG